MRSLRSGLGPCGLPEHRRPGPDHDVPTLRRAATVEDEDLPAIVRARCGLVGETAEASPDGSAAWTATGPIRSYRRTVEITPGGAGSSAVVQVVHYRLAVPLLGWLIALPARRRLGRLGGDDRPPWWGPPAVLDEAAWTAIAALATLSAAIGYLSTLLTQTVTYSAVEFHAGPAAQGAALAAARGDVVISIALVAVADRRGRRLVVVGGAAAGCGLTALGSLTTSLAWLAASQVLARGFVTASSIAAAVLVAEVMPRGARAWAAGIVAMATAVGAGVCVLSLPVAGLGVRAWRLLYLGALVWLLLLLVATRHLEESDRFERHRRPTRTRVRDLWGRRLALLGTAFFLLQLFIAPATQFRNEYLRHERGFSPSRISLYTIITVLPGALGIVVGGRLADTRGRRGVGIAAVLGVAAGGVAAYVLAGWTMWVASALASLTGSAVIPALSVYGPELFATEQRGMANGILTGAGRVGSIVGLLVAGALAQALGRFGPAFAALASGPVLLAILIACAFPETAHRSLEELNEEDREREGEPPIRPGPSVHSTG